LGEEGWRNGVDASVVDVRTGDFLQLLAATGKLEEFQNVVVLREI